ncbi:hypothetical protein INT46_007237 [Mucor plumbeus]|uniref:Biogenesis of lysosome-related organelles complex 1 subunit 4 n=1 Tax=Mucor plumbeus TaxID=97098 RepID=A0A8H7QNF4_9FUNG|nr:hypothetical protein INT46_007237 [Mucor plumbeus]
METIVNEAVDELNNTFSIQNTSKPTIDEFNKEAQSCMKRIKDTTDLITKVQSETDNINQLMQSLKSKDDELQAMFNKIDQLELLVTKVKNTYNAVAENLDIVEKAVNASTPFRLGNRYKSDMPIQPYFPPPNQVDIYDTNELFTSTHL